MLELKDCLNNNCGNIIKKSNALNKKLMNQYIKRSKNWKKTYLESRNIEKKRSACSLKNCDKLTPPFILELWKDNF